MMDNSPNKLIHAVSFMEADHITMAAFVSTQILQSAPNFYEFSIL